MIKKPVDPFLDFYDTPDMIFNSTVFGGGAADYNTPPVTANLMSRGDCSDPATLFGATVGGSAAAANGNVARIEDKSGGGYHVIQGTAANQPIRKTAVQNGRDVVRFDAVNDGMDGLIPGTSKTTFVVVVVGTPGVVARFFTQVGATGADYLNSPYIPLVMDTAGGVAAYNGSFVSVAALSAGAHVLTSVHTGTAITNYIDGVAAATASHSLALTASRYGFGAVPAFSHTADEVIGSDLCEWLAYSTALTSPDRAVIESWLKAKWGTP